MDQAETVIELPSRVSAGASSSRQEARRFFITSAFFLAGFLIALVLFDSAIGAYLRKSKKHGSLGAEVYAAKRKANWGVGRTRGIKAIFLGDSVSHQLFRPGTEPRGVRFLTTNQAVSAAGQFYLLDDALRHYHDLTDAYIFYLPRAWENDLPREYTHDYFCAYFHSPAQVLEVFETKRDFELSFAHAGRWLMPNIMEANSLQQPTAAMRGAQTHAGTERPGGLTSGLAPPPPDPESMLSFFSRCLAPPPPRKPPVPPDRVPVVLSPVSRHYLPRMRKACAEHHVRLHVLPCPASRTWIFADPDHVFDAPIINDIDPAELIDPVHFKEPFIVAARERVVKTYGIACLANGNTGQSKPGIRYTPAALHRNYMTFLGAAFDQTRMHIEEFDYLGVVETARSHRRRDLVFCIFTWNLSSSESARHGSYQILVFEDGRYAGKYAFSQDLPVARKSLRLDGGTLYVNAATDHATGTDMRAEDPPPIRCDTGTILFWAENNE